MILNAATTTGCTLSGEKIGAAGAVPEEIGKEAALLLIDEIVKRGCVDTSMQSLVLLFMALCPEDISKVRLGPLSDYTIQYVQHLKQFFWSDL